jgi:hypothetical protein
MKLLIEEYRYDSALVKDVIRGLDALEDIEGRISISYVGYYYNPADDLNSKDDCVFILPKVLLKKTDEGDKVFGKYTPESLINLIDNKMLSDVERKFIYEFAVWIYRAIVVFNNSKENDIVYHKKIAQIGFGKKRQCNTFLDVLLSLIQFNKDNQSFFFYVLKNMHSGLNKINWTKTVSLTTPIIRDGKPIYHQPINKKRQINFDEELLTIFFSILNYIATEYGFVVDINCNFQLIKGTQFQSYMNGIGKARLRQIKYKYFSDKALELWNLCYAFFDATSQVKISATQKEYLLVKNFNIVFEAIIDELIGDNPLPDNMSKKQEDGKIVDHLFTAKSLIENDDKNTYYIGDSKYYKIGHEVGSESVYKQYTYARNVIQWNLDIFNRGEKPTSGVELRDDITEGYNIIPNFFISATMNEGFDYTKDGINQSDRQHNKHKNTQFKNRLFDRDTLLLFHYDVNFLFVLSLYARNSANQKQTWKEKVRNKFREEIQDWLQQDYEFYAMKAHPNVNGEEYIRDNFKRLIGKIHSPFTDKTIYSLALDSSDKENNDKLISDLRHSFYIEPCNLGDNPQPIITQAAATTPIQTPRKRKDGVLMVMMEKYNDKSAKFITTGQIAIGIKDASEYNEILKNIDSIGYILFHTRKDIDQHLFALDSTCVVKEGNELVDVYKNIKESSRYLLVSFRNDFELVSTSLHSTHKPSSSNKTRYDSQFAWLDELK